MTTWAFWEQTIYSLAGFGFGVLVGRYLPQRRPPKMSHTQERRVSSRRAADGKRDIPRFLTILILVMMVLTVGGVVQNTIAQNHLRDQRHKDTQKQLAQTGAIAQNAQALAERVQVDEQLLSNLVVTISKARRPKQIENAIHKFIRKSQKEDGKPLPGVPPTSTDTPVTPPVTPSSHQVKPSPAANPVPSPSNKHPPPRHPPRPKPSPTPKPVVPVHVPVPGPVTIPNCLKLPLLGPIICQR